MSPSNTPPTMDIENKAEVSEISSDQNVKSLYTIQEIPGKGKGLIAAHPLTPGSLLLSEPPLFTTENITSEKSLRTLIKSLPKDSQKAFLYLHNAFPGSPDPFIHIIRSNAYPLGPGSNIGGVFPTIARINHSCIPNCQHSWNAKLGREVVYVLRDIEIGEEITLSYHPGGPSIERKEELEAAFNFVCTCRKCNLPEAEIKKSDARLIRAASLDNYIGNSQRIKQNPEEVLAKCRLLLQLFKEEEILDTRVSRVFYDAFQICLMHSDAARAKVFAERYRDLKVLSEGGESADAREIEEFIVRPEGHGSWGLSRRWRSGVGDVPKTLSGAEFERWLWREKK